MDYEIQAPFEFRDQLGEGPHWDVATQTLLRVDALGGSVLRLDPASGEQTELLSAEGEVGFVVPTSAGGVIASVQNTIIELGLDNNAIATVDPKDAALRINDGKCDSAGRAVFGTLSSTLEYVGALYRLDWTGRMQVLAEDIAISNGMGWDDSRERMYYIDSRTQRIDLMDYKVTTGAIGGRRPFVAIPAAEGLPDGLAVDSEGGVWVALFGAGEIRRYAPDGSVSEKVTLPVTCPTSITFGGPDLSTAYVTSGTYGFTDEQKLAEPLAGAVLTFEAGVAGTAGVPFGALV